MISNQIYTVRQLIFKDINFKDCQNFALNRIFHENVFKDEQIVSNRIRQLYNFKDK